MRRLADEARGTRGGSTRLAQLHCKTFVNLSLLVLALSVSGCLVKGPPDLEEQEPERANLNLFAADPPITRILSVATNERVNFNIPYTVFDAGEKYQAQLWLDWGFVRAELVNELEVLPNSESPPLVGKNEREIAIEWQVGNGRQIEAGCHTLTLQFTPAKNVSQDFSRLPLESSLVAAAEWWMNVDVPIDSQQNLENCPSELGNSAEL